MGASLPWLSRPRSLMQLRMGAAVFRPPGGEGASMEAQYTIEGGGIDNACTTVRALLANHGRSIIDVHLACGWSRLLLLPSMEHLISEQRWRTYAQARFEQVFGDEAQAWEIRVARDLPGRDRIAVAWPQALRAALAAHRNVRSVRVGLLEHLGILLAHEPEFSGCLIEVELDSAGFVLLLNGRPRRVRWTRYDDDEGLGAAVRSEWATVLAAETSRPNGGVALGLVPPVPDLGTARAATVAALAAGLGFNRAFSLPEWP